MVIGVGGRVRHVAGNMASELGGIIELLLRTRWWSVAVAVTAVVAVHKGQKGVSGFPGILVRDRKSVV